jgi:Transposase DDE domain
MLARRLWGKLFGDRGYISHDLFARLWGHGVQLVTKRKKKMKNALLPLLDKILLRKRTLIEM